VFASQLIIICLGEVLSMNFLKKVLISRENFGFLGKDKSQLRGLISIWKT